MSSNNSSPINELCLILPHELVSQILIVRYILLGTLCIYAWELVNNVFSDYKLLSKYQIRLPTILYFISRVSCLAVTICIAILETTPLPECRMYGIVGRVTYIVAIASTSLLFFFRVHAVFYGNPWTTAFFAGCWVLVVAASSIYAVGVRIVKFAPTNYCISEDVKYYTAAAAPLIYDTLIFLAMTWQFHRIFSAPRTLRNGIRVMVFGEQLPAFSKAFLQDGQAYYLTTVIFNLISVIILYCHSIPPVLRTVFTVPNLALMNIMACRVYRNTKFGYFKETQISTTIFERDLKALALWEGESGDRPATKHTRDASSNTGDGITFTQTARHERASQDDHFRNWGGLKTG